MSVKDTYWYCPLNAELKGHENEGQAKVTRGARGRKQAKAMYVSIVSINLKF